MASFSKFVDELTGDQFEVHWTSVNDVYLLEDDTTLAVEKCTAWCRDCHSVVLAERIETDAEKEAIRERLSAIEGTGDSLEHLAAYSLDNAALKEKRWLAFKSRESLPRCLDCFQTDLFFLDSDPDEATVVPDGPTLREVSFGFADIGLESRKTLNLEGQPVEGETSNKFLPASTRSSIFENLKSLEELTDSREDSDV